MRSRIVDGLAKAGLKQLTPPDMLAEPAAALIFSATSWLSEGLSCQNPLRSGGSATARPADSSCPNACLS